MIGKTDAATRVALVGSGGGGSVESVLEIATALLGKDADLQLLDRAEVGRVLREHELSLGGLVGAEHAIQTGQLLQADLFAVLEGSLTNETEVPASGRATLQRSQPTTQEAQQELRPTDSEVAASLGLVVFDAKTGARYADSALRASNVLSAASATAAAVRAAVVKFHRDPQDLHTVGLLPVRNADLPRQLDGLCDTVGLLLEHALTASPGIAVLERRRLEQVTRERGVAPDAEDNRLLSSLRMIELDIGRDGAGLRGTLALVAADGARSDAITASVSARDAAALAHLLADKTERFLKVPADGILTDRAAEALRFHREYLLLLQHRDYVAAVHPLDAAIALAPEQTSWQPEMALLLPYAAIGYVDPGGENWQRALPAQPSAGNLASCLALAQRCADLMLDLARKAAQGFNAGEPIPEALKDSNRSRLVGLLQKLPDVTRADPASAAEMVALAGKERTLRMEIMEPFLSKQAVDKTSFVNYTDALVRWFRSGYELYRSDALSDERDQDDVLALRHWVEVSHKLNPPDGSGDYRPAHHDIFTLSRWNRDSEFRETLEQDQDPMIRIYARASRVIPVAKPNGSPSAGMLAVEREFRLYAQDLLAHGEAAKPGYFRSHVWKAIKDDVRRLANDDQGWQEFLETCHFDIAQGDIQPDLFYDAFGVLENPRHRKLPEELELVNDALKLVLENPGAYPTNLAPGRIAFMRDLQKKRDQLAGELAGASTNAQVASTNTPAPSPWKQQVCLFDLTTPKGGLAWLFKPVVQDGQVFAAALGFDEWGLPEDNLQLVRVPLEGGPPTFLGRAKITGIDWLNREPELRNGPQSLLTGYYADLDVERAACFGAGCYIAATRSGVYLFPTNGGPVLHLGTTNGLPSDDAHAVAFLDGKLYIGASDGYLVEYEPASGKAAILASSRRSQHVSPFDDQPPFHTLCLVNDTVRHRLVLAVSSVVIPNSSKLPDITPSMGIWAYLPTTGEYKRLAPLRLATLSPPLMRGQTWAGMADPSTLVVKGVNGVALFDLRDDRLLFVTYPLADQTNAPIALWQRPRQGYSGASTLVNGPFLLRDGWFYSARPFDRMTLADGRREQFPPLRTDYPFEPKETLQLMDDGKHVLAADQFSLWLLELNPAPARNQAESR